MKNCLALVFCTIFLNCAHHISTQCITDKVDQVVVSGKPVIKVGDRIIHEGHIQTISEINPGFKEGWNDPEAKSQLVASIIEQELFLQKAQELDLISTNERLQKNLWLQIRNYQAGTYLLKKVDERAREQYEKDKQNLYTQLEISDIVIAYPKSNQDPTEEQKKNTMNRALEVRKKINSKNFSQIASETTDNPIAKLNGGKIGSISKIDQRIRFLGWQPLVDKAFLMKKGQISNPIATNEGVHIIQVTSSPTVQQFEDVLPFIRTQIEQQVKQDLVAEMLKETKVEYLDPTLDPNSK